MAPNLYCLLWQPLAICGYLNLNFSSVQSLNRVWLFATSLTAAHQASLSITNSWSLLKLMSIESMMPSNHLILCCPHLLLSSIFPTIRVFSNELALRIRWTNPSTTSASTSVLPMDIQDWFPLGWTGWISLQFKSINSFMLSYLYSPTLTSILEKP